MVQFLFIVFKAASSFFINQDNISKEEIETILKDSNFNENESRSKILSKISSPKVEDVVEPKEKPKEEPKEEPSDPVNQNQGPTSIKSLKYQTKSNIRADLNSTTEESQTSQSQDTSIIITGSSGPSKSHVPKRRIFNVEAYLNNDSDQINSTANNDAESDDDFDENSDEMKPKDYENVAKFLLKASFDEICAAPGVSEKKADLFLKCRPWKSWRDMIQKINKQVDEDFEAMKAEAKAKGKSARRGGNKNGMTQAVWEGVHDLLTARNTLTALLKKCVNIANHIRSEVTAEGIPIEEKLKAPPKCIQENKSGFVMKPYQLAGMNWLCLLHESDVNGILADEMGLGKTLQTIAFLTHLCEEDKNREYGPHLIIVPASTLDNWLRELNFWSPKLKVCAYYGTQDERKYQRKDIIKCAKMQDEQKRGGFVDSETRPIDIVLTTYTCAMSSTEDRMALRKVKFYYAVFDEGHMLKNMNTNRYQQLMKVNTKRRLLLTGTPVQNSLLELISLLKFVMPSMFDKAATASALTRIFGSTDVTKQGSSYIQDRVLQAREIMQPFVLRRLKENVLQHLPKKQSIIEQCNMTIEQERIYLNALEEIRLRMKNKNTTCSTSGNKNNLMHLRKISTHPSLVRSDKNFDDIKLRQISKIIERNGLLQKGTKNAQEQYEDLQLYNDFELNEICKSYTALNSFVLSEDRIALNSGKFELLNKMLPDLKKKGSRTLIFSQFTMLLDVLEVYLKYKGYRYLRMDGTTPVQDRLDLIDKFNKNSEIFLFILSTKAGGLGINLTAANTVIIHDLDMNPYNDKQAEDRCHRFGQTKNVDVFRLLTKKTVDISIFKRATAKLKLEKDMTSRQQPDKKDKEKEDYIDESEIAEMMRKLINKSNPNQSIRVRMNSGKSESSDKKGTSMIDDDMLSDDSENLTTEEIERIKVVGLFWGVLFILLQTESNFIFHLGRL